MFKEHRSIRASVPKPDELADHSSIAGKLAEAAPTTEKILEKKEYKYGVAIHPTHK